MIISGNLPPSVTVNDASEYFNNFFKTNVNVSQNVDDAIIGFFQSITGNRETGITLASAVLYTALNQGIEPMAFIDELRKLKTGKRVEQRTPIDSALFNSSFNSYQAAEAAKNEFEVGQMFYNPTLNVFYQTFYDSETDSTVIKTITGYKADRVILNSREVVYNYFRISYAQEENELNAYLTMLLNLNRVNTSLLGISNQPHTSKYISRAILP